MLSQQYLLIYVKREILLHNMSVIILSINSANGKLLFSSIVGPLYF